MKQKISKRKIAAVLAISYFHENDLFSNLVMGLGAVGFYGLIFVGMVDFPSQKLVLCILLGMLIYCFVEGMTLITTKLIVWMLLTVCPRKFIRTLNNLTFYLGTSWNLVYFEDWTREEKK